LEKRLGVEPPCFPLGWPHVANSFSPGSTAWMRVCVCVCVYVRLYARGCTRVGVRAWVYAWWSRGPPECYSITNDQRMERRHKTGPKRPIMPPVVTSWSPRGHLVVTSWSPRGDLPAVRPVQTRGLRLVVTYMETPRPLSVFFEAYAGPIWGDSGEVTRIYTSKDI
jgi:hypothetical protein